jgi:hypothetical protein
MSYSQLMSEMTLGPSVGTSSIQYEAPRISSYDTPATPPKCQRRKHLPMQGMSSLVV